MTVAWPHQRYSLRPQPTCDASTAGEPDDPRIRSLPFTPERYPATLPAAARRRSTPKRHPVVVVGGGPVGYCTALGLASHGVPVVLLEADDSVCFGSRAICISRRSLEIVERLGALPTAS